MSTLEKLKRRFFSLPIPADISFREVERLAKHYGCTIETGGNHQIRVKSGNPKRTIPIPTHGKAIKVAYINELAELFLEIEDIRKKEKEEQE